mgnify:CR=1 FL=1
MAALPENVINISQGVTFTEQPSYTWYVNPVTGRISGMADGFTAVKQAVEILFSVDRFLWQIYSPNFGMEWEGLVGQNPGYVALEIQRRAKDAIRTDSRMKDITGFFYQVNGDSLIMEFTVQTVYGPVSQRITV